MQGASKQTVDVIAVAQNTCTVVNEMYGIKPLVRILHYKQWLSIFYEFALPDLYERVMGRWVGNCFAHNIVCDAKTPTRLDAATLAITCDILSHGVRVCSIAIRYMVGLVRAEKQSARQGYGALQNMVRHHFGEKRDV